MTEQQQQQQRHDAGAPASQGGQFRGSDTPQAAVTLTAREWNSRSYDTSGAIAMLNHVSLSLGMARTNCEATWAAQEIKERWPTASRLVVTDTGEQDHRWRVDEATLFDADGAEVDAHADELYDIAHAVMQHNDPEDLGEVWVDASTSRGAAMELDVDAAAARDGNELHRHYGGILASRLDGDALEHALRATKRKGQR